jgi:hypothetical protein
VQIVLPAELEEWARAQADLEGVSLPAYLRAVLARWRAILESVDRIEAIARVRVSTRDTLPPGG